MSKKYTIIGLMSGTSLDGADLACCEFELHEGKWKFDMKASYTYPYSDEWRRRLGSAMFLSAEELALLNVRYGEFLGNLTSRFMLENQLSPDLIASHGHTVFHRPDAGLTLQIGSGAVIAAQTGIPTVCDFRTQDVALGGQGAPLVPVGDNLLFADYNFCLNLGGFSNISFDQNGIRKASDICPVNIVLNQLAQSVGLEYDKDGEMAASGKIHYGLLEKLNGIGFYSQPAPKSLGREWVESAFLPILHKSRLQINDQLRTVAEHIAIQISLQTKGKPTGEMLVTGGGAMNTFLISRIKALSNQSIIIPEKKIVDFKEALIFAFLGLLRYLGQPNCLASVTGADRDHSSGAIYL